MSRIFTLLSQPEVKNYCVIQQLPGGTDLAATLPVDDYLDSSSDATCSIARIRPTAMGFRNGGIYDVEKNSLEGFVFPNGSAC